MSFIILLLKKKKERKSLPISMSAIIVGTQFMSCYQSVLKSCSLLFQETRSRFSQTPHRNITRLDGTPFWTRMN